MTSGVPGGLNATAPLLEAVSLSKSYGPRRGAGARRAVQALDGVSLEVHPGDRLAIVGESGSGKSTLARLFLALEEPTAGEPRSIFATGQDWPICVELSRSFSRTRSVPLTRV
jgi:ABC-type glutathione transport system ATPase component